MAKRTRRRFFVLAAIAFWIGVSDAAAQTRQAPRPWVEFPACGYQRNVAWFDLEYCGAVFDKPITMMRQNPTRWYLLIDGFSSKDEPSDLARRRAWGAWFHVVENLGERPDRILLRWRRLPTISRGEHPAVRVWLVEWGKEFPPLEWSEKGNLLSTAAPN